MKEKDIFTPRAPGTLPETLEKYVIGLKKAAAAHGYNLSMVSMGKDSPNQAMADHYKLEDVLVFVAE